MRCSPTTTLVSGPRLPRSRSTSPGPTRSHPRPRRHRQCGPGSSGAMERSSSTPVPCAGPPRTSASRCTTRDWPVDVLSGSRPRTCSRAHPERLRYRSGVSAAAAAMKTWRAPARSPVMRYVPSPTAAAKARATQAPEDSGGGGPELGGRDRKLGPTLMIVVSFSSQGERDSQPGLICWSRWGRTSARGTRRLPKHRHIGLHLVEILQHLAHVTRSGRPPARNPRRSRFRGSRPPGYLQRGLCRHA